MSSGEPAKDVETGDGGSGANLPPEPDLKGPLKPVAETTMPEKVAMLVAGCAVITSLIAMIVTGGAVVYIAGILTMVMGPYAYVQQTKLTDIAALKETAAAVEHEVNRLKSENERLSKSIDELGEAIDGLQDVEETLQVISQTQGQSVEELERQVQENKEILAKMKQGTKGRVMNNLISVIYRGDKDEDDMISADEADEVIKGLHKIGGLKVHEDRLKKKIVDKSTDTVIEVIKNLLNEDTPEDERIFEIDEE